LGAIRDELIGAGEVAAWLRMSRRTVESWRLGRSTPEGFPDGFLIGGVVRWRARDIQAYVDRQANGNGTPRRRSTSPAATPPAPAATTARSSRATPKPAAAKRSPPKTTKPPAAKAKGRRSR